MKSGGRFDAANSSLAIIASAATIASVVVGWQWKSAEDTATAKTEVAEDLSSAFDSVEAERDALAAENRRLQAENDALKDEDETSDGTTRPLTPAAASTVYRQGQLTFQEGTYPTDFDAPLDDPQWGRNSQTAWPGEDDLTLDGGAFNARLGAQLADPLEGAASYEACTTANYSGASQDLANLPDGTVFCVRTTDDRFVGLELLTRNQDAFTFQVTTWNSGVR